MQKAFQIGGIVGGGVAVPWVLSQRHREGRASVCTAGGLHDALPELVDVVYKTTLGAFALNAAVASQTIGWKVRCAAVVARVLWAHRASTVPAGARLARCAASCFAFGHSHAPFLRMAPPRRPQNDCRGRRYRSYKEAFESRAYRLHYSKSQSRCDLFSQVGAAFQGVWHGGAATGMGRVECEMQHQLRCVLAVRLSCWMHPPTLLRPGCSLVVPRRWHCCRRRRQLWWPAPPWAQAWAWRYTC